MTWVSVESKSDYVLCFTHACKQSPEAPGCDMEDMEEKTPPRPKRSGIQSLPRVCRIRRDTHGKLVNALRTGARGAFQTDIARMINRAKEEHFMLYLKINALVQSPSAVHGDLFASLLHKWEPQVC